MISTACTILNRYDDVIHVDVHLPATPESAPVVIICHGFKGFKDWGMFPHAADVLAEAGFLTLRFNFSLNGVTDDFMNFTALENFERNTISREIDDLKDVIDAVNAGRLPVPDNAEPKLAVIGHSLGGGVSVVTAAEDERINAVVSWAGVADFDRWGPKFKAQWRELGRMEILNARTGQLMPMGIGMLDDLERNATRFDICAAASRLQRPLLLLHGEQDVSVPIEESQRIASCCAHGQVKIHSIPTADHTFGAVHPFAGTTRELDEVLATTTAWLRAQLHSE